jgi:hypothetical protein
MRTTRHYTSEEIEFVRKNIRGRSYFEMRKMFNNKFRLRLTEKQFDTLMYKHKLHNGLGTWNGYSPPNKGKRYRAETHWKNYKPVGYERVSIYQGKSYIEIKTGHCKGKGIYKRKHTAIWEAVNGRVPKGYVVIFGDRNRRNFDLDNLILVSRKELGVMNSCGLIYSNKEMTAVGKTIADVKMAIGKRKRKLKKRKS